MSSFARRLQVRLFERLKTNLVPIRDEVTNKTLGYLAPRYVGQQYFIRTLEGDLVAFGDPKPLANKPLTRSPAKGSRRSTHKRPWRSAIIGA